jgi:predicted NUDIX family NTP pyrophosphohydrolase
MPKVSSGLLLYRRTRDLGPDRLDIEVLLVHPGGPIWAKRDEGAWSIPKGEYAEGEDPAACAAREFEEELGVAPPGSQDDWSDLGEVTQSGGKRVRAWALAGDIDTGAVVSNTFEMEWPPRSGRRQSFPEVDRAAWMTPDQARRMLNPAQVAFVDRLLDRVSSSG